MKKYGIIKTLICLPLIIANYSCWHSDISGGSPVPRQCAQMVVVVTDSVSAAKGSLFLFERKSAESPWEEASGKIPVALGKNGIAWGIGLHKPEERIMKMKKEGDKKSPAGMFTLSAAFGFASIDSMKNLKIPYLPITAMLECIDDTASVFYNEITLRDKTTVPDWRTSEKMVRYGKWYDQGIVVDHNKNPKTAGAGSCIFLHNWVSSDETTHGCIEMDPVFMKKLMYWLDAGRMPVIVILNRQVFGLYKKMWGLPEIQD